MRAFLHYTQGSRASIGRERNTEGGMEPPMQARHSASHIADIHRRDRGVAFYRVSFRYLILCG